MTLLNGGIRFTVDDGLRLILRRLVASPEEPGPVSSQGEASRDKTNPWSFCRREGLTPYDFSRLRLLGFTRVRSKAFFALL